MLAKAQAAAAQAAQQAREAAERAAKQGTEALAKAQKMKLNGAVRGDVFLCLFAPFKKKQLTTQIPRFLGRCWSPKC